MGNPVTHWQIFHVRFWDELLDRYLGAARRSLSIEDFEREWNSGHELPFDDAVKLALEIRWVEGELSS